MQTVVEALGARAASTPDGLAFADATDRLTFGRLLDDATRVARVLTVRGVGPGDRCAIILPSGLDFVRIAFGAHIAGLCVAAFNPRLAPDTTVKRLALIRPALAVVSGEAQESLAGTAARLGQTVRLLAAEDVLTEATTARPLARPTPPPDSPALLLFTSGTTGEPKTAIIHHRHLAAFFELSRLRVPVGHGDVFVNWLPLYHNMGLIRAVCGTPVLGWACHLVPPGLDTLRAWLDTVSRVGGTVTSSSDFGFRTAAQLVDPGGLDLASLRVAFSGGERVRASTIDQFERRFNVPGVILPSYGLSEATLGVTCAAPGEPIRQDGVGRVSCGRPYDGLEIRIVGSQGSDAPTGEPGEIAVGGPTLFAGYFDDEPATRAVLREGWLHTGDQGAVGADGHLYVHARTRALIKHAGVTIVPNEVEEAAERIAGIGRSAAIGVAAGGDDDERLVVVAEMHREHPAPDDGRGKSAEIAREIRRAIGIAPERVLVVPPGTIPLTDNGKIRYPELRRLVEAGRLDA
jgi:acyl-CoA synthetase (AMP-forming)/AMP-acid ligase II